MAKSLLKIEARKLRQEGESIKQIAKKIGVSSSSVSVWCRDIKLTEKQVKELEIRAKDPKYGERLSYALKQQNQRTESNRRIHELALKDIGKLSERELFLVGVSLYWAEGFKKDSQAGFANLDPKMIKIFINWLKKCFKYNNEDLIFRLSINSSHGYREEDIKKYWQSTLKIGEINFQKTYFQKTVWKKVYSNPEDYYGILRVKVRKSTDFLRKIAGWIEGLSLSA